MTAIIVRIGQGKQYRGAIKFSAYYASSGQTIAPKKLFAYQAEADTIEDAYKLAIEDIQQKTAIYIKSDRWTVTDTETGFTAVNKESGSRNTYESPSVIDMWF